MRRRTAFIACLLVLAAVAGQCGRAASARAQTGHRNPVVAADFPDPAVLQVGGDYYATATASPRQPPLFAILRSSDLIGWVPAGTVFTAAPGWASGSFWAPEMTVIGGRFVVYYTARKRGGPLCVASAVSTNAAGPYADRGPLVCQRLGSIDPTTATGPDGRRWLVWKEDANSRKQRTYIWAQALTRDGRRVTGRPHRLLSNRAPWEGGVVEGPTVVRRGGWLYLLYSGNRCCGRGCRYAMGVARARTLIGPWRRNPANPILRGTRRWKCPGHGSVITAPDGGDVLMYHAYLRRRGYGGRAALVDRITWSADGWPVVNGGRGPSPRIVAGLAAFTALLPQSPRATASAWRLAGAPG